MPLTLSGETDVLSSEKLNSLIETETQGGRSLGRRRGKSHIVTTGRHRSRPELLIPDNVVATSTTTTLAVSSDPKELEDAVRYNFLSPVARRQPVTSQAVREQQQLLQAIVGHPGQEVKPLQNIQACGIGAQ
ncbi:unnamed protein product [Protopolystoma xenopodis]|uniref:Uncharacterized protein n=1 Tax=Protopolystoma xenopodis TaxID=117903 RepID=A0A448X8K2_9PLAT|nr:unnamed protein product [Protopolystoma xenopodis]